MTKSSPLSSKSGTLFIVATPIGNLGDITMRAAEVLAQVDLVLAEDTRHSRALLNHLGINKPMLSLHEHNEEQQLAAVTKDLQAGKNLALISDAGTPLISDPGYRLVSTLSAEGLAITPIPGACALIAALSASGLPSDSFCFQGFLASKSSKRQQQLQRLATEPRTMIFYESSHRILEMMADVLAIMGADRELVVARELTKKFESFYRGSAACVLEQLKQDSNAVKGEFVVLLHGAAEVADDGAEQQQLDATLKVLLAELPLKQAVSLAVQLTGLRKNVVYERAVALKSL